jgi:hypothetical protein
MTRLLRRAADWLVEMPEPARRPPLTAVRREYPLVAVIGLAHRCGATTIARALAAELAGRDGGAAVVASPVPPAVVALGSSTAAVRLAEVLTRFERVRPAGRLCLAVCPDASLLAHEARSVAPAVAEVEPGAPAMGAAPVVDQTVLVASPDLEPALAATVADTIAAVAPPPILVVNRAADHGPWLTRADVLVPDSRVGARLALSGREPRGWLGKSIQQLADLCAVC